MDRTETLSRIHELGLLAVLRGPSRDLTLEMVDALLAGGVHGIEITFSTPEACRVVELLAKRYGDRILLGMGTLTSPQHAIDAQAAGALFVVSPHCEAELARAMATTGLAVMIGALSPTEIVQARSLGADVVKIFPGSLGGPDYMRSLRGPFPDIPMMPTGGVTADSVRAWFAAGAFALGAGSELCPPAWAKEGRFEDITRRAEAFVQQVREARTLS